MNGPRARETVQKLWNASKSLQGGGVSYYEYVTELTYLLFLKMAQETGRDDQIPAGYRCTRAFTDGVLRALSR